MRSALLPTLTCKRRRSGGAVAVAVAGLCLAGQFVSFAHQLAVRHVTCLEHGEIIHADAVASGGLNQRSGAADHTSLRIAASSAAHHRHDPCLIWAQRRERGDVQRPGASIHFEVSSSIAVEPSARTFRATPAALLLLAPKSSPPA